MQTWVKLLAACGLMIWLAVLVFSNSYHVQPPLDPAAKISTLRETREAPVLINQPIPKSWFATLSPPRSECGQPVIIDVRPLWGDAPEDKKLFTLPERVVDLESFGFLPRVQITGYNEGKETVKRTLPMLPTKEQRFVAMFIPDLTAFRWVAEVYYRPTAISEEIKLETPRELVTETDERSCKFDWGAPKCESIMDWAYPTPLFFFLSYADGRIIYPGDKISMQGDKQNIFVIRPHPMAKRLFPDSYKNFSFNIIFHNDDIIKAADFIDLVYDEELGGNKFGITPIDGGRFAMEVYYNFVNGAGDILKPPFAKHLKRQNECMSAVGSIYGAPFSVSVNGTALPVAGRNPLGLQKCKHANANGRWIRIPQDQDCEVPLCSGKRADVMKYPRNDPNFMTHYTGAQFPWVWLPYDCYHHLYSPRDIVQCSKKANYNWFHVQGDSPIRETATNIMMQFNEIDNHKFHHVDLMLTRAANWTDYPLRLTYEFWHEMFDFEAGEKRDWGVCKPLLDHFNLVGQTSVWGFEHEGDLKIPEKTHPNVLVFTPSIVFAIWKQRWADYVKWMNNFKNYIGNAIKENKNMKAIYFSGPYLHSPTNDPKADITINRFHKYNNYAINICKELGFEIVDLVTPTQTRPDAPWDGVHYSVLGGGIWVGSTSHMLTQIVLNVVFPDCEGS